MSGGIEPRNTKETAMITSGLDVTHGPRPQQEVVRRFLVAGAAIVWAAAPAWAAAQYNMTDLGTLGGSYSDARGINNAGQITGETHLPGDGSFHAYLYDHGVMQDIHPATRPWSSGERINDLGQIAGFWTGGGGGAYAMRYTVADWLDLGALPGGRKSTADAINATGQITGEAETATTYHAYFYDGTMHDLGTLGGIISWGRGINDIGQIVGMARDTAGADRAFLYSDGVMYDINSLIPPDSGWTMIDARDINNSGVIVAYGWRNYPAAGHAFLLTPSRPVLKIVKGDNAATLTWSTNAAGYVLQSSLALTGPYSTATNAITVSGTDYLTTCAMDQAEQFFRLKK
jgi:probable HAF family extracellular repeat protein